MPSTTIRKPITQCGGDYPQVDWVYTGGWNLWVMGSAPGSDVEVKVKKSGATRFALSSRKVDKLMRDR